MFLREPEEPKPTLWEYRREVLKESEMYPIGRDPDDAHLQTWNGLGLRGWELVSVVREDDDVVGYLKREHRFGVIEEEWRERGRAADIERENRRRTEEEESRTEEEESRKEEEDFGFLKDDDDGDEPLSDYEKKRGF
tara:strand:- start:73 stop:483 length:411 start_codon:yes stop_codon:yes gene_type:complete